MIRGLSRTRCRALLMRKRGSAKPAAADPPMNNAGRVRANWAAEFEELVDAAVGKLLRQAVDATRRFVNRAGD